jgi:hypothetical protein
MREPTVGDPLISQIFNPCPASIWLLGAAAQCCLDNGHDGMHKVVIQWTTAGG